VTKSEEPLFRAGWAKFTVGTIKRWPHQERARLIDAVGAELRATIRGASSLSWQHGAVFLGLCERIAGCGADTARAFWRYSLRASIDQPLIGTLVQGGLALWGATPLALYARTPRAWSMVSRHCGELRIHDEPSQAVLEARGLPPIARRHEGLLRLWEGGFCGQADFVGCRAEVTTDASQFASAGAVRFTIRWQPAG
jgi:hypothetical protein